MVEPQVKASKILHIKKYIDEKMKADDWDKIIALIPEKSARDTILGLSFAAKMIPETMLKALFVALEGYFSTKKHNLSDTCYKIGVFAAQHDVPKFFKVFIRFLNIDFMINNTPNLWHQYHTHGRLTIEKAGQDCYYIKLYNYPVPNKCFCYYLAGYIHGIIELAGFKLDTKVKELECVLEKAPCCKFSIIGR